MDSMIKRRQRQAFRMIKMRSEMNIQLLNQNMGFDLLDRIIKRERSSLLIYAFSVIKVLFEFKNELDHEIKLNSKMVNVRANVNNKLLRTNRIRRRFIRNKEDFIFHKGLHKKMKNSGGAADEVQAMSGSHLIPRTSGINNFIVGNKAVSRVRDKQYYDDEDVSTDEEVDTKIAYPVMQ